MLKDKDFSPLLKFYVSFTQNHSDSKRKHLSHCIGNNWFYTLYVIHWKKKKKRENVSANQMGRKIVLLSTIEPLRQLFFKLKEFNIQHLHMLSMKRCSTLHFRSYSGYNIEKNHSKLRMLLNKMKMEKDQENRD